MNRTLGFVSYQGLVGFVRINIKDLDADDEVKVFFFDVMVELFNKAKADMVSPAFQQKWMFSQIKGDVDTFDARLQVLKKAVLTVKEIEPLSTIMI